MDTQNLSDYFSQAQQYNSFLENEENRKQTYEFMKEQAGQDLGLAVPQFFEGVNNFVEKAQKIASNVEKLKGQVQDLPTRMQNIYENTKAGIQRTAGRVQDIAEDTMNKGKQFLFKTQEQGKQYLEDLNVKTNTLLENTKKNIMKPVQDAIQENKTKFQEMKDRLGRPLTEEEMAPFKAEAERIKGLKQGAQDLWESKQSEIMKNYNETNDRLTQHLENIKNTAQDELSQRAETVQRTVSRDIPRSYRDRVRDYNEADPEQEFSRYRNEPTSGYQRPEPARPAEPARPTQPETPRVSEEPNIRPSEVNRQAPQFETPQQQLPQVQRQAEQAVQETRQAVQQTAQETRQAVQETGEAVRNIAESRVGEATQALGETRQSLQQTAQETGQAVRGAVSEGSEAVRGAISEGTNIAKGAISEGSNIAKQAVSAGTKAVVEGATEAGASALEIVPVVGEVIGTLALIGQGIADLVHHPSAPPPEAKPDFVSGI